MKKLSVSYLISEIKEVEGPPPYVPFWDWPAVSGKQCVPIPRCYWLTWEEMHHKQDNHMELIILLEAHCHCALKCSNITLTGGSYKMFESGVCNRCWEAVEAARPLGCPTLPPASLLAPSPSSFPLTLLSFPLISLSFFWVKKKIPTIANICWGLSYTRPSA